MKWNKKRLKKLRLTSVKLKHKTLLAAAGIILVVYGIGYIGNVFLRSSGLFIVKEIKISGNNYIPQKNIQTIANVDTNQSMFQVVLPEVKDALLRNKYIRGVSVMRELPSTILIDVQEREPSLYLVDNSIYMVDETGLILEKLPGMAMGKAPLITGLSRKQLEKDSTALFSAIELVRKIREVDESLLALISEVKITKNKTPELVLIKGGAHVLLGETNHYTRLFILSQFLHKQPIIDKLERIRSVDLTYQDRIIINHKT